MHAPTIAVVGAGNWGTTLAVIQARAGRGVVLCTREEELATTLKERRENIRSLPGVAFPEALNVAAGYTEVANADLVLLAVASAYIRSTCRELAPFVRPSTQLVSAAKGLEHGSMLRVSQVIAEEMPAHGTTLVVLSGPNLAGEIVAGLPAAAVLASADHDAAVNSANILATPLFRLYTTRDVVGVELGGSLKNVVALAAGISDGLGMGTNSKAAIVTRGMAEIVRLGRAAGADPLTFAGLSGYGDLFATCVSPLSRNHFVGEQLGRGQSLASIRASMTMVAEGVDTARAAQALARYHDVEMPITDQVCAVLFDGKAPRDAVHDLLSRLARDEQTGEAL